MNWKTADIPSSDSINYRPATRVAVFMIVLLLIGITVMVIAGLSQQSMGSVLTGLLVSLTLSLPLAWWFARWAIRPLVEVQLAAKMVVMKYGDGLIQEHEVGQGEDFEQGLKLFATRSQERILTLEAEQNKVAVILNSMGEGVIALDEQTRILFMNPSARMILDLGLDIVEGQSLLEVIRHRGLADLVEKIQTQESTQPGRKEIELHMPVHRILEAHAIPLPISGTVRSVLLVLHDITELRRLEQVRAEFVANVSHELRTPLTAIKGYLETLLEEVSPEPQIHRRFLEVAHANADRMNRLINDLLSLSDIETGKVVLHLTQVVLEDLVSEVCAIFAKDASRKGVRLINEIPPHLYAYVDRDRLSQILLNLVDNAVKYTSKDGRVTFKGWGLPDHRVTIQVEDTGQGIPANDLPRITERFYRVDKARSREEGGTGLGLAIVKHLVQLQGGTLRIESEFEKGTTIEMALPAEQFDSLSV